MACRPSAPIAIAFLLAIAGCGDGETEREAGVVRQSTTVGGEADQAQALGRQLMSEGELAAAGEAFDRALALDPDRAGLWVDIARLRYRGGEHFSALDAAERALALGPGDPEALWFSGQLVRDAVGPRAALPFYRRAAAPETARDAMKLDFAATLGEAGQADEALGVIRDVATRSDLDPLGYRVQAVIAARAGNWELANALMRRAGPPEEPAAMLLSGLIDLQLGNAASAAQTFDRLAALQPDNRLAALLLARALAAAGSHRELVHRFAERAARDDAPPYLKMLMARSLEAVGERGRAAAFLAAARAEPGDRMAVLRAAPEEDDLAIVAAPINAFASRLRDAIGRGDRVAVRAAARELHRRFPGSADAASLAGDAHYALEELERALVLYERAARIRTSWSLVRRMALAHARLGDRPAARRTLRAFLVENPGHRRAAALLAET